MALTKQLVQGVGDTAAYGDNIDKMSQKMGLSAQAYQEWDAIMQHSGTSIESLQSGMKTLANAVENGNAAFERLGITQEDIASMNNEELFSATITALQNVENETERTYLAGQLLGKGATELGALLNTSAEETEAMRQRVHELGGVMSDEAVKAAAAYQDSLQDMQTAFSGISRGLLSEFLPSITSVMDGITAIFSGDGESGIQMVSEGLSAFLDNLASMIPKITAIGGQILSSLSATIIENLPLLFESGVELIGTLGQGILNNLPVIIDAAVEIVIMLTEGIIKALPELVKAAIEVIAKLADGIAEHLPELIPATVEMVLQIVESLIDNVDKLIDAAIAITLAIADGLIESLPRLLEKAPEIIAKLVEAIIENAPKLLAASLEVVVKLVAGIVQNLPKIGEAAIKIVTTIITSIGQLTGKIREIGSNIVSGVWNGINEKLQWFKDKVTGFFSGIVNGVKSVLGIASPSKVFAGIGENMALGVGKGWDSEFGGIKKDIEDGMDFGSANVDFKASGLGRSSAGFGASILNAANEAMQPIIITVQSVLDGKVIGETAYKYNRNRERAYGV